MILTILLASLFIGCAFGQANPLGNIDVANATLIAGWACDPDNFNRPVQLDILVDNNIFAGFVVANLQREAAVGQQCGGVTRHGFSFTFPANIQQILSNGNRHTVSVNARPFPPQGPVTPIPGSPVTVQVTQPNRNPIGNLDVANATIASGWACDPDAFNSALRVDIYVDNSFVGSANANQPREAAVGQQCGGNSNKGFVFTFPPATQQLLSNGQPHTVQAFAINTPTGNNPQLSGSPKTVLVPIVRVNTPPRGFLDVANATTASGWACDPDAFNSALRVDIYVDNNFVGSATANLPREAAVGQQCGGNSNKGFFFTFPAATQQLLSNGQPHTVQAFAINTPTGDNPQLSGSPKTVQVQIPNRNPIGNLDVANATVAAGWACDPDAFSQALRVDIYVDNSFVGSTTANLQREAAVGQQCGGNSNRGFFFTFPAATQQLLSNGQPHTVQAFAINVPTGNNPQLSGSPKTVLVPIVRENTPPRGFLDVANVTTASGWACDPDDFNFALRVDIYVDNSFVGSATANLPREAAVGQQCGGNNNKGWIFTFPAATQQLLSNGQPHTVQAYAINTPTGDNPQLSGSPKTVQVQVPNRNPIGNLDIANVTTAAGWACDPDAFNSALRVDIYVDNSFVGSTTANLQREAAVGQQCGGNSNRGFVFTFPAATQQLLSNGQPHTVQAYAINTPTGNNPQLSGSPKTVQVQITNNAPKGFLDSATTTTASGWACDPDAFNTALRVDIYVGNPSVFAGSTTANLPREPGVAQACGGNANHGWTFTFSPALQPGTVVRAYAINTPTGNNPELSGSPKNAV